MVAIKDMEMPNRCDECQCAVDCECPFLRIDVEEEMGSRDLNCPLVEIITCKDCKYYREDDDTGYCTNHTCGDITFWCHDDYYCADAERRE